mgnify:CR=1 FL=1
MLYLKLLCQHSGSSLQIWFINRFQKIYKTESKSYNNSRANIDFRDAIAIGDIIIPKKGRQDYLGYGIVTSDYYYDNSPREKQIEVFRSQLEIAIKTNKPDTIAIDKNVRMTG